MHLCSGNAPEFQNSVAKIKGDIHNVGVAKVSEAIPLIHSTVYSFSSCIEAISHSSLWQFKCELFSFISECVSSQCCLYIFSYVGTFTPFSLATYLGAATNTPFLKYNSCLLYHLKWEPSLAQVPSLSCSHASVPALLRLE